MWDIAPEFNALLVFAEHRSRSWLLSSSCLWWPRLKLTLMNIPPLGPNSLKRYYGDSLPFGKNSTSKDPLKVTFSNGWSFLSWKVEVSLPVKVGYLSSSQALADYADLITSLKVSVDFNFKAQRHCIGWKRFPVLQVDPFTPQVHSFYCFRLLFLVQKLLQWLCLVAAMVECLQLGSGAAS